MFRMIGFIIFWIAVGMALSLLVRSPVIRTLWVIVLILVGYNLFCCGK